jgi:hypothetical protein
MRNFPVFLLHAFGPSPKATLSDRGRLIGPNIFVQIQTLASGVIDYKLHFMYVM